MQELNHPLNQVLIREQVINKPLHELFPFFTDAKNLEAITPPWLNFNIVNMTTSEIQEGTIINYQLKLYGIPLKWQSKIESWQTNKCFVDTQLKGPYTLWHHTHSFYEIGGKTHMVDKIIYRVPFGWIGLKLLGNFIRGDINKIFDYRYDIITKKFNS